MRSLNKSALAATLLTLSLAACNGGDEPPPPPSSSVQTIGPGAYALSVQGDSASVGTAFLNAQERGYLLLSGDGDQAHAVVHRIDGRQGWRAPASAGFVTLSHGGQQALSPLPLSGASLAGSYQLMLGGKPVAFSVNAEGRITAAGSDCQLSGQIDLTQSFAGARELRLSLSACGSAGSGSYQGLLFATAGTAPAAWQAVLENGSAVLDLLVYR